MTEAIACHHLSKSFGKVHAVENVELTVERGEILTLLGPSGCGKTTVLRLIAGFERPDRGTIAVSGRTVSGPGTYVPPEKRRVGMVFQDYALFPHHDAAWNVGYGVRERGIRAERVAQVLALVGMPGYEHRFPHQLSGGEQQRVALARALAPEPEIILMDEPFSNLDARLRVRVRSEVRDILRKAGQTAIFVTHDQDEALSMSDRVAVMLSGRILQIDSPEALYRQPATREVAELVGDATFIAGEARGSQAETSLGMLPIHEPAEGPVYVLLRPEEVTIDGQGGVQAEIVAREFYGHDQMLVLQLADGERIQARRGPGGDYAIGQSVCVAATGPVAAYPRQS